MIWRLANRNDAEARGLADRHYNRQHVGAPGFVPPGRCLVLKAPHAFWVTSFHYPAYVKHRWPGAWVCSAFRREGGAERASDLIRSAIAATCWKWRPLAADVRHAPQQATRRARLLRPAREDEVTQPKPVLPDELAGLQLVASVSGGKDSTALMLALREAGLPFRAVFADTKWEAPETYLYLDLLRARLGIQIDVVGVPGGMEARVMYRAGFPARMQRWCTRELKLEPLRKYHDAIEADGTETVCVVGVRAAESEPRSKMPVLEDEPPGSRSWGGWVWRPLIAWSVADVLEIHRRHGIPVNPLYRRGHDRVGCYPCIFARKEEVRLLPDERIVEIRVLEQRATEERVRRNAERPGRYTHPVATFFQGRNGVTTTIDDVRAWSNSDRGGRQMQLLEPAPTGGCMRWGLCETSGGDK